VGTIIGLLLLRAGLAATSTLLVLIAAAILTTTLQPLVKLAAAWLFGVRYSYAYLWGIEPRFKLRFGTYLSAERWQRVLLHLTGTVGSPAAFLWVGGLAAGQLPAAAAVCSICFWVLVVGQALLFVAVARGRSRLGPFGLASLTSAGAAAAELRAGAGART
jgi:hypothetical protein